MRIQIESAGGVASRATLNGHSMVFDQPVVDGGGDLGPSPLHVFATAVGACAHYYAAVFLSARQISPSGLSVDLAYEKSTDRPARIASMTIDVHLPADVPEKYLAAIERAVRSCPAQGTLASPPTVTLRILQRVL